MVFRRVFFKLRMPAPHVVIRKSGIAHHLRPFLFAQHLFLSPSRTLQQPRDGPLLPAQPLDVFADPRHSPIENCRKIVRRAVERRTDIR